MMRGILGWKRVKNGLHWPAYREGKAVGYYFTIRCRLTGATRTRYVGTPYTDSETGEHIADWAIV